MELKLVEKDIEYLKKAVRLIEQTENSFAFPKSKIIFDICNAITELREKSDKQNVFVNQPEITAV